jgi:hypothetical protein
MSHAARSVEIQHLSCSGQVSNRDKKMSVCPGPLAMMGICQALIKLVGIKFRGAAGANCNTRRPMGDGRSVHSLGRSDGTEQTPGFKTFVAEVKLQ